MLLAIMSIMSLFVSVSCGSGDSATDTDGDGPPNFVYNPGDEDDYSESGEADGDDLEIIDGDKDNTEQWREDEDWEATEEEIADGDGEYYEDEQPVDGDDTPDGDDIPDGDSDSHSSFASCSGLVDCPGNEEICELSLGRCEYRKSLLSYENELYSFHPRDVAVGDLLVVDGNGFMGTNPVSLIPPLVHIGSDSVGGSFLDSSISADGNRLLIKVTKEISGPVSVTVNGFTSNISVENLGVADDGVIECDGSTPEATFEDENYLLGVGPYAAAYLDFLDQAMRVFYPAQCGSVRHPPVDGTYPLVVILHGNGSQHIQYEYLAQLLATWGFISLMPESESENDSPPEVHHLIYDRIEPFLEADLGEVHYILDGLSTTTEVAMIGHSRGCARMQNTWNLDEDLKSNAVASIFLGPAEDEIVAPGMFMVIGASKDGQSFSWNFDGSYNRQSAPKWKVWLEGGNHSLFGDHKVYTAFDGVPDITRRQQLEITASFVLPLLERAFGLEEHWPEMLDNPPASSIYTVTSEQ